MIYHMHLLPMKIISVPLNKLAYTQILAVVALMVWELKTQKRLTSLKGQLWAGSIDYNMALKGKNTAFISSLAVYLMAVLTILSSNYSPLEGLCHLGPTALLGTFIRVHDERSGNVQVLNKWFFSIKFIRLKKTV